MTQVLKRMINAPGMLPMLTCAAILIAWELGTRIVSVPSFTLPAPSRILGGYDSITLPVTGAVVAEFVAAEKGIGYFIHFSTSNFKLPQAWAGLALLVVMSLSLFLIVEQPQKRMLPWSLPKGRR